MSRRRSHVSFGSVLSHLGVIVVVSAVLGVLVAGLAVPVVGALGYGAKATAGSLENLPEELEAEPLAQRSRVVDSDGNWLATFYDENRVNIRLGEVAPVMRRAIVAIEDYRFYEHGALDLRGTLRAFVNNQAGNSTQGGSSITQQMAKMTLVTQAQTEEERAAATANTYQRKLQELRHAIAFEKNYSKNWILERYLNLAYFGDGAYGIQAASRHYFSVDASELNLRQAATLAGLVKNPVGFDPTTYPERAEARRNVVVNRMAELGVISQERADLVAGRRLGLQVTPSRNGCLSSEAPFFCDYVRRYLLEDPALGETVQDRAQLLNEGGLTISTTIDQDFQRAADTATRNAVDPTDQAIGGLAMVEPGTGEVRAISQSRPMGREKEQGETFLNYTVNSKYGDANGFQAGSTFKVFVLAAALEQGISPSTAFRSPEEMDFPMGDFADCTGSYPSTDTWPVGNSTTSGRKDLVTGTRESVNTFFAQLERETGLCEPYALAKAMGVELTDPGRERVPSFTLGVADVSPLEMAGAYATFAARGQFCEPRPVTEIRNAEGEIFKDYPAECSQVIRQSTADEVNRILEGVINGGFGSALALDKPAAGKTGTINSQMAVWFNGYTPTMSTAAMVAGANQDGNWVTLNGQVVGGTGIGTASGSTLAGPMWAEAMRAVSGELPYETFTSPTPGDAPIEVPVDDVEGMRADRAVELLTGRGFQVYVSGDEESRVTSVSPAPGSGLTRGSTVTLSAG
ncbi:transglycosylase domain-containing protein [Nocardioides aequoreus]|uniref:transglycosylase domain-containing protein n=1 Tax=Nocardioides aequoreus TaxID=397278 RepID=UPI0004C3C037|nr:transglycosylase domain-containing protein [Nocardioides aequoreus]